VISIFAKKVLRKQPLQIFGDGSQTRDFIFVSDVVDATIAALERPLKSRVFNIATGNETTILELAKTMQRITKSTSSLNLAPPRSGDIARSVADIKKAQKELGFTPGTPLDQGLSATIEWLAPQNRPRLAN
ncbi:NAD-dependent epimerase/dehydratase family protein, partial [bacterium]